MVVTTFRSFGVPTNEELLNGTKKHFCLNFNKTNLAREGPINFSALPCLLLNCLLMKFIADHLASD